MSNFCLLIEHIYDSAGTDVSRVEKGGMPSPRITNCLSFLSLFLLEARPAITTWSEWKTLVKLQTAFWDSLFTVHNNIVPFNY